MSKPLQVIAQCDPARPLAHERPHAAGHALNDIWGFDSFLFAVGDYGTIIAGNGSAWWDFPSGVDVHLNAIWGTGLADIWVVGDAGTILHWDGKWSQIDVGTTQNLKGVWADSSGVVVAGDRGQTFMYDRVTWTPRHYLYGSGFLDVWGTSMQNVFAVGYEAEDPNEPLADHSLVRKYDGTQWTTVYFQPNGGWVANIWSSGPGEYLILIGNGRLLSLSGQTVDLKLDGGTGLWGRSATDVMVVGRGGQIARGSGTDWDITFDYRLSVPRNMWGDTFGNIYIVDRQGSVFRHDGESLGVLRGGDPRVTLYGIHGSASDNVYAVGRIGIIQHYDGTCWAIFPSPSRSSLYSVHTFGPNNVFVASESIISHWDGMSWTDLPSLPLGYHEHIECMWGVSPDTLIVTTHATTSADHIYRYDGNSWAELFRDYWCHDIWGSSANDIYFATNEGHVLHYDGEVVESVIETGTTMYAVSGCGPDDVWATGYAGTAVHWNGIEWTQHDGLTLGHPTDMWISPDGVPYVMDEWSRRVHWFNGVSWPQLEIEPPDEFSIEHCWLEYRAIWGSQDCALFVAGTCGFIFQREPVTKTSVLFQFLEATVLDAAVELHWRVVADEEIQGYRIYRRATQDDDFVLLTANSLLEAGVDRYIDYKVRPGYTYAYRVAAVCADGGEIVSAEERATLAPAKLALFQNHPNPFKTTTYIRFHGVPSALTKVQIYDVSGRLVSTIWIGRATFELQQATWNARDSFGNPVGSGIYFCRLSSGGHVITRKIALLK